ncbi:hypothetical protein NE857_09615 [Nocardiopsis exhalans]|uniref:Uncharacterized protein n=1 Tax=Nocardiopsis exhalans TaxID=163604 RepID=A0ABY5DFG3_9ACTN|nr:hypothetical protein [Nocardiopsis exhalans]USY21837.1 hypothetical protein NE857_09615 [Nocardiopsis exhalans]
MGRTLGVEAWREGDGAALVVDVKKGFLRAASDYDDFSHLEKANKLSAVLPGGGWSVFWGDEGKTEPIFAWLVSESGRSMIPVTINRAGEVEFADSNDGLVSPDGGEDESVGE